MVLFASFDFLYSMFNICAWPCTTAWDSEVNLFFTWRVYALNMECYLENLFNSSIFSVFSWRAGFNLVQNEYRPPHRDIFIYEEPKLCYVLQIGYWYSQVPLEYMNSFSEAIYLTVYVSACDNNSHESFEYSTYSHDYLCIIWLFRIF